MYLVTATEKQHQNNHQRIQIQNIIEGKGKKTHNGDR